MDSRALPKRFFTFRDYWRAQPGQKALKTDWEATWRNWCRHEGSFEKQKPLSKGEIRIRETTQEEKANDAARAL